MSQDTTFAGDAGGIGQAAAAGRRSGVRQAVGAALALLVLVYLALVWNAPSDRIQGVVQKILYVHAPVAFSAYLAFVVTAIAGALYLWRGEERYDRLAFSSAEVGVLFCTLVVVTGPIWARAAWGPGNWWSWDLRLTVTLILWFIYLAYWLLRSFTEGGARTARFAAVYGIVGVLAIPLNYFAIDIAGGRSAHPSNLESGSLGPGMGWPFLAGAVTMLVAYLYLLLLRVEVAGLQAEADRRAAEAGDEVPEREAEAGA